MCYYNLCFPFIRQEAHARREAIVEKTLAQKRKFLEDSSDESESEVILFPAPVKTGDDLRSDSDENVQRAPTKLTEFSCKQALFPELHQIHNLHQFQAGFLSKC